MIGRRMIFRRPLPQHVLNFIDERLGPRQRGALIVTADSFRDRLDGGRQPKHSPIFLQRLDILRAKYSPTAGIDYELVTAGELPADIGLQIAKVVPSLLGDDLRNRTLRTLDDLRIG